VYTNEIEQVLVSATNETNNESYIKMMKMKMQVLGWKATVKGNELIDIEVISRKKKVWFWKKLE
jgi:hypothetical protein